jgi:cardiolipin synthase
MPTGPADELDTCALFFVHAIHSARRRIWISSPYFVPDARVMAALQLAVLRGVDVRVMLPERPDHLLVYLASFSYYEEAIPNGVKIYRYGAGFLHQKAMLVDDGFAAVGTANMDPRSFQLHFEITIAAADHHFAEAVREMFERDFADCRLATMEDLSRRSLPFRLAVRIARLFEPVL